MSSAPHLSATASSTQSRFATYFTATEYSQWDITPFLEHCAAELPDTLADDSSFASAVDSWVHSLNRYSTDTTDLMRAGVARYLLNRYRREVCWISLCPPSAAWSCPADKLAHVLTTDPTTSQKPVLPPSSSPDAACYYDSLAGGALSLLVAAPRL